MYDRYQLLKMLAWLANKCWGKGFRIHLLSTFDKTTPSVKSSRDSTSSSRGNVFICKTMSAGVSQTHRICLRKQGKVDKLMNIPIVGAQPELRRCKPCCCCCFCEVVLSRAMFKQMPVFSEYSFVQ